MATIETVMVKRGDSYAIINKDDFDPKVDVIYEGTRPADVVSDLSKNPSGTFSQPTPTDIRFPNKDLTEFENNHGAFVKKSAAQIREAEGMIDAPGGLAPDPDLEERAKEAQKGPAAVPVDPAVDNESKAQPAPARVKAADDAAKKAGEARAPATSEKK